MLSNWMEWQINFLVAVENFRDFSNNIFDDFFLNVTRFGEMLTPIFLICLVYWCINKKSGIYITFSLVTSFALAFAIKIMTCIYRPWIIDSRVNPLKQAIPYAGGYSFPSGHSANATAAWGAAAISFWKYKFSLIFVLLVILVVLSRIYLGVHTLQDIIGGLLIGLFSLFAVAKLLKWEENGKNRDLIISLLYTLGAILLVVYAVYKPYPLDYVDGKLLYDPSSNIKYLVSRLSGILGLVWGWFIEKRFVKFEIEKVSIAKRVLRLAVGFIVLNSLHDNAINVAVSMFGPQWGTLISYFVMGIFLTGLYPFVFKTLKF